jgi:hypothetical protein
MRATDVPKEVLVNPTADEFLRALTESLNFYRADTETVLAPHHISLAALSGPEGYREWTLFRLTEVGRGRKAGLTAAWWTGPPHRTRYIRLSCHPIAQWDGSAPFHYQPLTPWAAVFRERAMVLHSRQQERWQKRLSRRLGTQVLHFANRISDAAHESLHLPERFREAGLVATTPDALLLTDRRQRPRRGALILKDSLGQYRLHEIPLRLARPGPRVLRRLGSREALVHAATAWLLKNTLAATT